MMHSGMLCIKHYQSIYTVEIFIYLGVYVDMCNNNTNRHVLFRNVRYVKDIRRLDVYSFNFDARYVFFSSICFLLFY